MFTDRVSREVKVTGSLDLSIPVFTWTLYLLNRLILEREFVCVGTAG